MKKISYIFLICFINIIFFTSFSWAATVEVEVIHSMENYHADRTYPILFSLKISKPWYIHGAAKTETYLIPTKLIFRDSPYLKITDIRYPQPERETFEYLSDPIDVYSENILIRASLAINGDIPTGKQRIKGNLSYQACSSTSCLPPEDVPVELQITIDPPGTLANAINEDLFISAEEEKGLIESTSADRFDAVLLLVLLGLFLQGLALNLTPCIYPLIPVTVSYFGGKSEKISGKKILHGVLYLAGLAVTNSLLGVSSAMSGSMLGSALQNPVALVFVACILTALGFSFFGFWELRIPTALIRIASKNYSGYFGTFFMGLTLGIVAAPCLGPFILGLLTYVAQRGDPFLGFLYFFTLSIGIGLPLCVLAIFSGTIDRLPISGDWMVWIKKLMGWVLIWMAAYMIFPLVPRYFGTVGLLAGVALISGVHLGWIDRTGSGKKGGFLYFKRGISVLILLGSILYLLYVGQARNGINWLSYDQKMFDREIMNGRPIILEVYADWCLPCRTMERKVFNDPEVVSLTKDIICIRLDLTREKPFQEEIIRRYRVWGAPTIIFINKTGIEEKSLKIESYVNKAEFLDRINIFLRENGLS
ncbi:thioredoxin family protein [Deltaproteobacteria bacterium]|nr:thioredoxin family protein [Deltaproteobacteria bacterium]